MSINKKHSFKVRLFRFLKTYFPNANFGIVLILITPVGLYLYYESGDILFSVLLCSALFVFVTVYMAILEWHGKRFHHNIIDSKSFIELQKKQFEIVTKYQYKGLKGVYRGYLFETFYDWNRIDQSELRKLKKAIVIRVYFESPEYKTGKYNEKKLREISERNSNSDWFLRKQKMKWNQDFMELANFDLSVRKKPTQFIDRMNLIVDILKKENLGPMTEEKLTQLRKKYQYHYSIDMDIYRYKDKKDEAEQWKKLLNKS